MNYKQLILTLLISTFIIRLVALIFLGDTSLENEWNVLVHNLFNKGVLGYYIVNNDFLATPGLAGINDVVLPSAFMPPLYAYFIYIIKYLFFSYTNFVNAIIIIQIIFSTIATYLFFKILQTSETRGVSLYATLVFSLIPINIYASVQISSISIQVFLLIYFFYILKIFSEHNKLSQKSLFIFSLLSGLLILLRGEFILFYFFTIFYFFIFYTRNFKLLVISILTTLIIISPHLLRNFYHFNTLTITKSIGYNLLKGNNPDFKIEGNPKFIDEKFNIEKLSIKTDKQYELKLDNFYKDKALDYIKNDPAFYIKNYLKKVLSFLFFDPYSSYEKYFNIFHLIPKLFLSILSILGGIVAIKNKGYMQYLSIYYFSNILFFSIFFILPRYSLILLPVQILLSLEFVKFFLRKFIN